MPTHATREVNLHGEDTNILGTGDFDVEGRVGERNGHVFAIEVTGKTLNGWDGQGREDDRHVLSSWSIYILSRSDEN